MQVSNGNAKIDGNGRDQFGLPDGLLNLEVRQSFPGIFDFGEAGIGVLPQFQESVVILDGPLLLPFLFKDFS